MRLSGLAFELDGAAYCLGDVFALAALEGRLADAERRLADGLALEAMAAAEGVECSAQDVQTALDAWRTERDLIAAEQVEAWLEHVGVELDDVVGHLERGLFARELAGRMDEARREHAAEPGDVAELLAESVLLDGGDVRLRDEAAGHLVAAALLGEADRAQVAAEQARLLAARVVAAEAALAAGLSPFEVGTARGLELAGVLARSHLHRSAIVTPQALQRELARASHDLVVAELVSALAPTADMAQELVHCVREDGEALEEAARRAKVPVRRERLFLEDLVRAPNGARIASARLGDAVGPFAAEGGRAIHQVLARVPATLDAPGVRDRVAGRLLARSIGPEVARRVRFAATVRAGA